MQPTERMTDEELLVLCALADEIVRAASMSALLTVGDDGKWRRCLSQAEFGYLTTLHRLELWTPPEGY